MSTLAAVDVGGSVHTMITNLFAFLPKLLGAIVIVVVFYLIAKALEKIIDKVLQKVGFDRVVERGPIKQALARSDYDAAGILGKIVFYVVVLIGLSTAAGALGNNPVSGYLQAVIAFLPKAFVALIIVVIAAAIATGAKKFIDAALGGLSYGPAVANVVSAFIIVQGVIAALNQIGVATAVTTPIEIGLIATIAGIAIVGVGGGLIRPMEQRWENALQRVSDESGTVRDNMAAQKDQLVEQAQSRTQSQPYPSGQAAGRREGASRRG